VILPSCERLAGRGRKVSEIEGDDQFAVGGDGWGEHVPVRGVVVIAGEPLDLGPRRPRLQAGRGSGSAPVGASPSRAA
jgi:hypothetical protein